VRTGQLVVTRVGCSGGTAIALVSKTPTRPAPSAFLAALRVHLEVQCWWRVDN
jgi:hypothetical protein